MVTALGAKVTNSGGAKSGSAVDSSSPSFTLNLVMGIRAKFATPGSLGLALEIWSKIDDVVSSMNVVEASVVDEVVVVVVVVVVFVVVVLRKIGLKGGLRR